MSIFARLVLMGGLVKLVLRTIWAQLHVPHGDWLKVSGSQRLGKLLVGLYFLVFAAPLVYGCWIGLLLASNVMQSWPPESAGIVFILGFTLIMLYGVAQLAIMNLAAAFLNFVIAWRGAKPPNDLS